MSENYSIERDLKEAEAMAQALIPYVYEDGLYVNVSGGMFGGGNMPSMTLGALLMRLRRLNVLADSLDAGQKSRLEAAEQHNQEVLNEWRSHYDAKLLREANSRLDAMRTFFDECASEPKMCRSGYRPEVLRRTISQEIVFARDAFNMDADADLKRKMGARDSQLRGLVSPTDFIWSDELQPAYPQDVFWWLYAFPPER